MARIKINVSLGIESWCKEKSDKSIIVRHTRNGVIHRDDDEPAEIGADGSLHWYKNGERHHAEDNETDDKPAEIYVGGIKRWYVNGKLHRGGDKPAEVWPDGTRFWYKNGELYSVKYVK